MPEEGGGGGLLGRDGDLAEGGGGVVETETGVMRTYETRPRIFHR